MPIMLAQLQHDYSPERLAELARLRYVRDEEPGILRRRHGRGFTYLDIKGCRLESKDVRRRIDSLAVPPAWSDVWICRYADGHLQVTGKDDKQRKQYIYHERWHTISNLAKFRKLLSFGRALPRIRAQIQQHLNARSLDRDYVSALLVALLDRTLVRIGNEKSTWRRTGPTASAPSAAGM